ncbi:acyltransferase [Azorhizobium oxalatiphilum]|uniref:Acyltransferase n=1 Tax=Azorhizobium oxalatiphilum TaxID=980631 RepID=A0A917F3X4_9HYPH|nr:acyltransferase family protein [Azorhizobium oxalatiphilum]GGF50894.1 acyltransferase [Azorhizobium oxalatiphilum]
MRYRADISGLRALAVVPVVLYHVDPRLVPGGYVGVDIFFVISGYLITSILASEMAAGRFSFLTFYDRRIRRIVPAYAVVMLATALVALATLPPLMLDTFGRSLQFASLFLANRHFLATAGYFAPGAEEQLLLHSWSLAVEEQFYLFWPVALLALFHPRLKRWRGPIIWALLIGSLYLASKNAYLRPNNAFYNFTSRAWELLLGAVLALGLLPRLRGRLLPEAAGLLGLALIGTALAFYTTKTVFPGLAALLPAGGALLLIWAGEEGRQTLAGRLLGLRPFTAIGLISYSLYLWHWPILGLYRFHAGHEPGLLAGTLLVVLAVALSALTWRFVEAPFRRHGQVTRVLEWKSVRAGVLTLAALAGLGFLMGETGGLPQRASAAYRAAEAGLKDIWPATRACLQGPGLAPAGTHCRFGAAGDEQPVIALWGDSFANHHAPALDAIARDGGFGLLQETKAGCAPQAPNPPGGSVEAQDCEIFRAETLSALAQDPQVKVVAIGGLWLPGPGFGSAMTGLKTAVLLLRQAGKSVVLIGPPPDFGGGGGARCILRRRFLGLDEGTCLLPAALAARNAAPVETALREIADAVPGTQLVLPRTAFCDAELCRPTVPDGGLAYIDAGHMNRPGSLHLVPLLKGALERAETSEKKS